MDSTLEVESISINSKKNKQMKDKDNIFSTEELYLGAFLHDIGKFSYRADSEKYRGHVARGEAFVKSVMKDFKIWDVLNQKNVISSLKSSIGKTQAADGISAKHERESEEQGSAKTRRPLISIFSRVAIGKPYKEKGGNPPKFDEDENYFKEYEKNNIYYYYPDTADNDSMPEEKSGNIYEWRLSKSDEEHWINKHEDLWKKFTEEVKKLKEISDFRTFFTSLYKICEKYTSRVCSAGFVSIPDISLFDHSRVVAGLSLCADEGENDNECLLIYGDVSGIQNFIYNEILEADKAAKQLRGRSFYVRLLADTIVNYLVRELDVYDANVMFSSGGHFLLAVPNKKDNREKYEELEKSINENLFKETKGKLFLVMTSMEKKTETFMEEYADVLKELNEKAAREKKRKSFSALDVLFEKPIPYDKNEKEAEEKFFSNIGENIVRNDYIIELQHTKNADLQEKLENKEKFEIGKLIDFSEFGISWLFTNKKNIEDNLIKLELNNVNSIIIHGYRKSFKELEITKNKDKIGFSFKHIGSYIPTKRDENYKIIPKTFEDLAGKGSDSYPFLGILRMDVDNLGLLFSKGLKRSNEKLDEEMLTGNEDADEKKEKNLQNRLFKVSRYTALSRELDYFFTEHINELARLGRNSDEEGVYLVYAGGDDLFAVGKWTDTIEFAQKVKEKFTKYTCHNQNFTISGGIAFVKPNFPIARSSTMAGDREEEAKIVDITKDRISLFGRAVKWHSLETLLNQADLLENILDTNEEIDKKETIPRGFLYNLLGMTQECFDRNGSFNVDKMYKTTAKIHYHFARRGVDSEVIEKKKLKFKRELAECFFASDKNERQTFYENFIVPASYVLLKTRNINK